MIAEKKKKKTFTGGIAQSYGGNLGHKFVV